MTHYDLLHLPFGESDGKVITKAYREQARIWHPDKAHQDDKDIAHQMFQKITHANEVLMNQSKRLLYDQYILYQAKLGLYRDKMAREFVDASAPSDSFAHFMAEAQLMAGEADVIDFDAFCGAATMRDQYGKSFEE